MIPCKLNVLSLKLIIISNHNQFSQIMFYFMINYNFSQHIMYILLHLCVAKDFWSFKILDQFWNFFEF
jgi:hypothetical protein